MKHITSIINNITMALNVLGTLLIVALMLLICADVIGRTVFSMPISGVPEMVSLSIVAIVFLQAAQAFRMGRFTRSEAILNYIGKKTIRGRAMFEILFAGAGVLVIWVLLSASAPLFLKAWKRDTFVGTVGDFIAPVWPVKLIILIGCSALLLQLVLYIVRQIMVVASGKDAALAQNRGQS
jgi:TRAP-type mannitol/chloroaromatic compound transport system permease small subunit